MWNSCSAPRDQAKALLAVLLGSALVSLPPIAKADAPIQFGLPRLVTADLGVRASGDFDGDGIDDIVAAKTPPTPGEVVILTGGTSHPLESSRIVPVDPNDLVLAAADLDGDGRADLIAGSVADSSLAVYRSLGPSGFAPPLRYGVGMIVEAVLVGDFNGDHWLDLGVFPRIGLPLSIGILLNESDGTLRHGPQFLEGQFGVPMAVGDFDGDSREDIVVASAPSPDDRRIRIYRCESDAVISRWADFADPGNATFEDIETIDVDRDRRPDLVEFGRDSLRVLRNIGGGVFQQTQTIWLRAWDTFGNTFIKVRDFDRDGLADVAVAIRGGHCYDGGCPRVSLVRGKLYGLSSQPIHLLANNPNSGGAHAIGFESGDFDGNGCADLVVLYGGRYGPKLSCTNLILNRCERGFLAPSSIDIGFRPIDLVTRRSSREAGVLIGDGSATWIADFTGRSEPFLQVTALASQDLNGDGLEDLLVRDPSGISVYLDDGNGGLSGPASFEDGEHPTLGDFDGDDDPDLALVDGDRKLVIRNNDGSGNFGTAQDTGLRFDMIAALAAMDLDRDGMSDLVVGRNNGIPRDSIAIHWNARGSFSPGDFYEVGMLFFGGQNHTRPTTITSGNFDGDAWPDLFVVNATFADNPGSFSVLLQKAQRVFSAAADYAVGRDPWEGVVADFDDDGRDDVAVVCDEDNWNGAVRVFRAGTTGLMSPAYAGPFDLTVEHYPTSIAIGDWNSDGQPDLVVGNAFSESITFLINGSPPAIPTSITVSLVSAEWTGQGVRLEWLVDPGVVADIERSVDPTQWSVLGSAQANGTGSMRYVDSHLPATGPVGYRLTLSRNGEIQRGGEVWVDLAERGARLALDGAKPNPARGDPIIQFNLPSSAEATLELHDVSGARIATYSMIAPRPGRHVVRMAPSRKLRAGVYFARLTQSGASATARVVVIP